MRCDCAKFKELSPILTVHRIVSSVLIYGFEARAMKANDLRSLERTEHMMVRCVGWGCP